ncbi:hypothetical protein LTR37_020520 [Vermiconidia calcicola]|uniref:Uncharacterized protein n=1 Tax=Vermiconidia calcicola TaxID=1690605 RepID=A0ACC3MCE1_9PEZI|nr:hypothetical protein LTR37_020520 [Vermiconidia calcicola]
MTHHHTLEMSTNLPALLAGRWRFILVLAFASVIIFLGLFHSSLSLSAPSLLIHDVGHASASAAQNETLGFGQIFVLTEDYSTWRAQGLREAAKFTGIRLTIPVQPHMPDEQSGHETALFLEDDVDFGMDIKAQMQLVSEAILGFASKRYADNEVSDYPYGKDWDVLWIGHYGVEVTQNTREVSYTDPFALDWGLLTSTFTDYYELRLPPKDSEQPKELQQRLLLNAAPMSTYAFALTRSNAERLIRKLKDAPVQRFDIALHTGCKGLEHRCVVPAPALLHHHKVTGDQSILNSAAEQNGARDLPWWRGQHTYTYNIEWSARCNAGRVGEKIGDRWQCMPGTYDAYDD